VFSLASEFVTVYYSRFRSRVRIWSGGWWRCRLIEETDVDGQAANTELLKDLPRVRGARRRLLPCHVLLGAGEIRMSVLDGGGAAKSAADWRALTTKRMVLDFGLQPQDHVVAFEVFPEGCLAVAVAAERSLVEALGVRTEGTVRTERVSVFPLVAARETLRKRSRFLMSLLEPGALSVMTDAPYRSVVRIADTEAPETARSREVARLLMGEGVQRPPSELVSLSLRLDDADPDCARQANDAAAHKARDPRFLDLLCESSV
jgi:hypothetical protein